MIQSKEVKKRNHDLCDATIDVFDVLVKVTAVAHIEDSLSLSVQQCTFHWLNYFLALWNLTA